ncbi:hypothetical protein GBAR_LOCUS20812, partial [Geodia barretti]
TEPEYKSSLCHYCQHTTTPGHWTDIARRSSWYAGNGGCFFSLERCASLRKALAEMTYLTSVVG